MWVIVNLFNDANYESWDIDLNEKAQPRPRSWIKTAVKTLSVLSYVPSTLAVAKFILGYSK